MTLQSQLNKITRDRAKKATTKAKGSSTNKYTWGNPTSANKTNVEKYLQAYNKDKKGGFETDIEKVQNSQKFFLFILNKISEEALSKKSGSGQTS